MEKDKLVYSTDSGRICPGCKRPAKNCTCREAADREIVGNGKVRLQRETKSRGGKTVITITGLPLPKDELAAMLRELKQLCGTGGTLKDGVLEIQGEHIEVLKKALIKRGYSPK